MVVEVLRATVAQLAVVTSRKSVPTTLCTVHQISHLLITLIGSPFHQRVHWIFHSQHHIIITNHQNETIMQSQQENEHSMFRDSHNWRDYEYRMQYDDNQEGHNSCDLLCCWSPCVCVYFFINLVDGRWRVGLLYSLQ